MKVRATKLGFFKGRRYPGDTFEVPDTWKAKWTEPVEAPAKPAKAAKKDPETLAEVQAAAKPAKKDYEATAE